MLTLRQAVEEARARPPDQFAKVEQLVKESSKAEARELAQVKIPLLARNKPGVISLTSPSPKYECAKCGRRNLDQPTLEPDGNGTLRFDCRCDRGSWTRDGRHVWNAIFAARDAGVNTVRV